MVSPPPWVVNEDLISIHGCMFTGSQNGQFLEKIHFNKKEISLPLGSLGQQEMLSVEDA